MAWGRSRTCMGRCRFPALGKGQNLQWATCYMRRLLECKKRFQMEAITTICGLSLEARHTLAFMSPDSTYIELVGGLGQAVLSPSSAWVQTFGAYKMIIFKKDEASSCGSVSKLFKRGYSRDYIGEYYKPHSLVTT